MTPKGIKMIFKGIKTILICFTNQTDKAMSKQKRSSADHADIQRRLAILSIFLLSLVYAIKTSFYFTGDGTKIYLTIAAKSVSVIFLIMLLITFFWRFRFIPRSERYHLLHTSDSYANQKMNEAFKVSWGLTFAMLYFITELTKKNGLLLPVRFYVDLTLFVMLATFSVGFFILFRLGGTGEPQKAGQ